MCACRYSGQLFTYYGFIFDPFLLISGFLNNNGRIRTLANIYNGINNFSSSLAFACVSLRSPAKVQSKVNQNSSMVLTLAWLRTVWGVYVSVPLWREHLSLEEISEVHLCRAAG